VLLSEKLDKITTKIKSCDETMPEFEDASSIENFVTSLVDSGVSMEQRVKPRLPVKRLRQMLRTEHKAQSIEVATCSQETVRFEQLIETSSDHVIPRRARDKSTLNQLSVSDEHEACSHEIQLSKCREETMGRTIRQRQEVQIDPSPDSDDSQHRQEHSQVTTASKESQQSRLLRHQNNAIRRNYGPDDDSDSADPNLDSDIDLSDDDSESSDKEEADFESRSLSDTGDFGESAYISDTT
jgi:hypothetical protein